MFIVGSGRSGSTAFAIAKALENNVPYGGELSPANVFATNTTRIRFKETHHEINVGASFTLQQYAAIDKHAPTHMYLLPSTYGGTETWGDAVGFITRKNLKNIARSTFCYMTKGNSSRLLSQAEMYNVIERALFGALLILEYCKTNNKEVTWYEDMFDVQTTYTAWDQSAYKDALEAKIDIYLAEFDPQSINPNIILT